MLHRRDFLRLVGAGGSATLLDACAPTPPESLIPYLVAPDDVIPGVAAHYATTCRECPAGCGMLAKTREGRVIKVEGNPRHPIGAGRLCVRGQAAVQSLYNPDRFRRPAARDSNGGGLVPIPWEDAQARLASRLRDLKAAGRGSRVVWLGRVLTGSMERLTRDWLEALGGGRRLFYEGFDYEPLRRASEIAVGRREIPAYHIDRARVLVSFGADFLETWISNVEFTQAYARMRARRAAGESQQFVAVQPRLSLTAASADAWLPVAPGAEADVALAMVHAAIEAGLASEQVRDELRWIRPLVAPFAPESVEATRGIPAADIRRLAREFCTADSLALGGGISAAGDSAVPLELAVLLLNAVAGNLGRTLTYGAGSPLDSLATYQEVVELITQMERGEVDVLLLHHVNPVFTLPAASGFARALERVPLVVSFSSLPDETAARAHLVLPDNHFLESWGDYAPRAGVLGIQQPAMAPLFDTRSTGDVLLAVASQVDDEMAGRFNWPDYHDWVRSYWNFVVRPAVAPNEQWEAFWTDGLQGGGRFTAAGAPADVRLRPWSRELFGAGPAEAERPRPAAEAGRPRPEAAEAGRPQAEGPGGFPLIVYPSAHFFDGRSANNPWLQEIPDPITKIVWSGWVELHPETAARLGLAEGDEVELRSPHGTVDVPVHLYAGLRPDVAAMPTGQGHLGPLRYAAGRGANPLNLLPPDPDPLSGSMRWTIPVTMTPRGRRRRLVRLQAETRPQAEAEAGRLQHLRDFYPPHEHPGHRWGMAIDLNACTGCNACVAACYAENNVPVVGEELCAQGREMSWLRIERYTDEAMPARGLVRASTVFRPMLCQHCDQAPCESVCPVYATYHNPEGLNAQIYNRCVGTRYCSNNCPYKVRRFNWLTWTPPDPLPLQLNPDVTVRSMGVMEKCTFCVQRIQAGKNAARREGRPAGDGEIVPACAQTCPAEAIVFGDLSDPGSRVSALARDSRGYHVLESLNTRPAVTYLTRMAAAGDGT